MARSSPKRRGELAELHFAFKAASRGLVIAKPWGDSLPFDFLVGRGQSFRRVQVKSTSGRHCRGYHVCCFRPVNRQPYTKSQVDFIAALVVPEQTWYIIPVSALRRRKTIVVFPRQLPPTSSLERYREAWHLLGK